MRNTCRFTNTFCFIDENSAINDNGIFKKRFKQTYLEELELEKENLSNPNSSFLDIEIGVTENKISTKINYRQNPFLCQIVLIPFLKGNIPSEKIFY